MDDPVGPMDGVIKSNALYIFRIRQNRAAHGENRALPGSVCVAFVCFTADIEIAAIFDKKYTHPTGQGEKWRYNTTIGQNRHKNAAFAGPAGSTFLFGGFRERIFLCFNRH